MSAFQQALANASMQSQASGSSTSTMTIRGASSGAPSGRGLASALRGAGIRKEASPSGMEVDGQSSRGGRPSRGASGRRVTIRNQGGPLDQSGRRPGPDKPYASDARNGRNGPSSNRGGPSGLSPLASRIAKPKPTNINPRRLPEGTPPILRVNEVDRKEAKRSEHKLSEKLGSEEMKQWLRSRLIAEGVLNFSALQDDPWLKEQGINPPGHSAAPPQCGTVFWTLIDHVLQQPNNTPIYTLSLANNGFKDLAQLARLPTSLPYLRALDLSENPIRRVNELDELLASGEKKGKANAGTGGLKNLIELKLNGCQFREHTLQQANGDETYQHDILKRFPSLLILDGVNLNRIVFPITRQPKIRSTPGQRSDLSKKPYTYPVDVKEPFMESEVVRNFVMQFCAKFFPIWDNDRAQLLPAYSPTATTSFSANTLRSRSVHFDAVERTRGARPLPTSMDKWTNLPGRNFFRGLDKVELRMRTLKSPTNQEELLRWWSQSVPKTKHPLEDPRKWNIDAWVLDGTGVDTRLCAVIEGEFLEMPSGTFRSFSRTFILADAREGSAARNAGWPALVLSDTMIVHQYYGNGAFAPDSRSLAVNGVTINPIAAIPAGPAVDASALGSGPDQAAQEALINQVRQRTGMNVQFASMCLAQNGWVFETALKNFEEIKASIPAEAYQ